jgi:uncharacterized protein (DUF1330 family)
MSAYVIVDIEIHDPIRYEEYKTLAHATVIAYDGEYLVRGGPAQRLEGDREPNRLVVLRFPSLERAQQWWNSEEYAPAKALRQSIARADMIVVEGQ